MSSPFSDPRARAWAIATTTDTRVLGPTVHSWTFDAVRWPEPKLGFRDAQCKAVFVLWAFLRFTTLAIPVRRCIRSEERGLQYHWPVVHRPFRVVEDRLQSTAVPCVFVYLIENCRRMLGAIPQILAMWRAPPWSQRLLTEVGTETFRFVWLLAPPCCFRADKNYGTVSRF